MGTPMRFAAFAFTVAALRLSAPTPIKPLAMPLRVVQSPQDMIVAESLAAGINPHLPLAIGWRESRYTPQLVAGPNQDGSYDYGVMQLNSYTVRVLKVANPLDARENIRAGVRLFARWLHVCGSERAAMMAYAIGRCK